MQTLFGVKVETSAATLALIVKLESDVKRLKCDLQLSRNRENELREQIVCYMSSKFHFSTWSASRSSAT
jgi:hypothetical protein